MIRTLGHRRLVQQMVKLRNGRPLCRCMCTGSKEDKDGVEKGIKATNGTNDVQTESEPSLSLKLAKPIGRLQYQKDPRYRLPGLSPVQLDMNEVSPNIDERLLRLAKQVAESVSDDSKEAKRTAAELEFMLKSTFVERESAKSGEPIKIDMMKILEGFEVEKTPKRDMKPSRYVQQPQQWSDNVAQDYREDRERSEGRRRASRDDRARMDRGDDSDDRGWEGSVSQAIMRESAGKRKSRPRRRDERDTDEAEFEDGEQKERRPPQGFGPRRPRSKPVDDIYSYEPLNIFDANIKDDGRELCPTWQSLVQDELDLVQQLPPRNAYEEMIMWTKQGKLWPYPIDNELGIESENNVPFYEHVFLDQYLNEFPAKGPIRSFMENVVLGLQNNPYITFERKKQTIHWFKLYFDTKSQLAKRVGAM